MGEVALAALFGGFLQELLYWYGLRQRLSEQRYRNMLGYRSYWIVTILMVVVGVPIATVLMHYDDTVRMSLRDAMFFGAGAPALLKQGLQTAPRPRIRPSNIPGGAIGFVDSIESPGPYLRFYRSPLGNTLRHYLRLDGP